MHNKLGRVVALLFALSALCISGCHNEGGCPGGHCPAPNPVTPAPTHVPPTFTPDVPAASHASTGTHTEPLPEVSYPSDAQGNPLPATPPVIAQDAPAPIPDTAPVVIDEGVHHTPPVTGPPTELAGIGTGTKRAVIVGINKFLDPGAPPLSGCVNDAKTMYKICIECWGFDKKNIILLLDEQATVANVKSALEKMVGETKDGDLWVYTQSSHGAEDAITPDAGGEPDHMNQMVCCTDFAWDRAHELIDKDFVVIFSKLPKGAIGFWMSDSCHSGDLDRDMLKPTAKKRTPKTITPPAGEVSARIAKAKARSVPTRSIKAGLLNVGFLSGCKADETSADTQDDTGVPCGALTDAFKTVYLKDENYKLPLTNLAKLIRNETKPFGQAPQAEGARAAKPILFP